MIRISQPTYLGRELEYVHDAVDSKCLSGGRYVKRFEELVAGMAGRRQAVATSSGTTALHLALLALGVKPGDKVVVPACSYIATANAVRYCGGEPVFVDVDPDTWLLDPHLGEAAVVEHGAVGIVTVDLYGVPCPIPVIPYTWVLEDACEAHGARIEGDVAVFSFYGNKIVTCGEGGAVVSDRADILDRCRLLRGQGTTGRQRYVHEQIGFNFRMTDPQAAIGCGQVERITEHVARRARLRDVYDELLPNIACQERPDDSVDWVMPILVPDRDRVAARLFEAGVETRPVFPPLHLQPPYRTGQILRNAELLGCDGLLLPLHLGMTEGDVEQVCDALEMATRRAA